MSLRAEIADMFAELDGRVRYHDALEETAAYQSARAVENVRQWRKSNPAKWRALNKRNKQTWRKRYPDKARAAKARSARSYRRRKAAR